jgi:hypothetical protein
MNNIKGLGDFDRLNEKKYIKDAFDLKDVIVQSISMAARAQKHVTDLRVLLSELDNDMSMIRTHFTSKEALGLIEGIQKSINDLESQVKRRDEKDPGLVQNVGKTIRNLEKLKDGFLGKPGATKENPKKEPVKKQEESANVPAVDYYVDPKTMRKIRRV